MMIPLVVLVAFLVGAFAAGVAYGTWASARPLDVEDYRVEQNGGAVRLTLSSQAALGGIVRADLHPVHAHAVSNDLIRASARARSRGADALATGAGE